MVQTTYFKECAFHNARKKLSDADVIISNHSLSMASIVGDGNVLPEPDAAIWVFDEAHHIPKIFRGSLEQHVSVANSVIWLKNLPALITKVSLCHRKNSFNNVPGGEELDKLIKELLFELQCLTEFTITACRFNRSDLEKEQIFRFKNGVLGSDYASRLLSIAKLASTVYRCVNAHSECLKEKIEKHDVSSNTSTEKLLSAISVMQIQSESFKETWDLLVANEVSGSMIAKWITYGGNNKLDLCFSAVPVSVSTQLKSALWDQVAGAVVTSATLTSLGSFDRFHFESGLDQDAKYFLVDSPFDYRNQSSLIIPKMLFDPDIANEDDHTAFMALYIENMFKRHKALLVLFSSYRQLNKFVALLPPQIKSEFLVQGVDTRPNLIRRHIERIDNGKRSALVGVASLGEGLDLRGKYLTAVAIAKIPFANFTNPIDAAEGEWIKQNGQNAFFMQSLPEASTKLIQQCGRLIQMIATVKL